MSLVRLLILMLGSLLIFANTISAQDASTETNEAFRDSLESMGSLPWYDSESENVRPINVKPRMDDTINRDSRWVPKPKAKKKAASTNKKTTTTTTNTSSGFWSSLWNVLGDYSNVLGWLLIGLIVAGIVTIFVFAYNKLDRASGGESGSNAAVAAELDEDDIAKLEHLPVQIQQRTGDLLGQADRLRQSGRIAEAIIYLFSHRLLQLDRAHLLRLTRGKTNRQYLMELRSNSEVRRVMENTVELFEKSYFGRYVISNDDFDAVRAEQGELESMIARHREAA